MELSNSQSIDGRSCYDATPVERNTRTIRLLRLARSAEPHEICCDLDCFSLETRPEYTALSYTWGSSTPSKIIHVNGIPFAVRANLDHFLDRERTAAHQKYYWIDAICINQARTDERNHQVGLMRDIYSSVNALRLIHGHLLTNVTGGCRTGLAGARRSEAGASNGLSPRNT